MCAHDRACAGSIDGRKQGKPAEFDPLSSGRLPPEADAPDLGFVAEFAPPNGREFGSTLARFGSSPPSDAPASRPPVGQTSRNCCRIEEPISRSSCSCRSFTTPPQNYPHIFLICAPVQFFRNLGLGTAVV